MKKNLIAIGACLAILLGISVPACLAVSSSNDSTFATTITDDAVALKVGHNLLLAGNNVINEVTVKGLLLAAGSKVNLKTNSEYAFVAGENVELSDIVVEKDLFVAGNEIRLEESAQLGRDVYAAANRISMGANLHGDFSAGARYILLKDVKIEGNVNIDAEQVVIGGTSVEITGKLTINADAEIIEAAGVTFKYGEIEKYEVVRHKPSPSAAILSKSISITGLFIAFLLVMMIIPRVDKRVSKELSSKQFVMDILAGFGVLIAVPIASLFLIMSLFAAPAGLLILLIYVIMIFLAQGFSGLWVGKLFMGKALNRETNKYLEALIGIILLGFASLIPVIGGWIGFFSLLLGLGLIVQTVRKKTTSYDKKSDSRADAQEAEVVKDHPAKNEPVKGSSTHIQPAQSKPEKNMPEERNTESSKSHKDKPKIVEEED